MLTLFIIILTDFICSSICRFSFEQKCMLYSWSFCYFAFYIMHQRYRFEKYNSCVKNRYVQKTTGSISYLSSVSPYIMYQLPEFECYMSTRQQTTFLKKKHIFFFVFARLLSCWHFCSALYQWSCQTSACTQNMAVTSLPESRSDSDLLGAKSEVNQMCWIYGFSILIPKVVATKDDWFPAFCLAVMTNGRHFERR